MFQKPEIIIHLRKGKCLTLFGLVQFGRSHCAFAGLPVVLMRAEGHGLTLTGSFNMFELKQSHGVLVDDISRSTSDN